MSEITELVGSLEPLTIVILCCGLCIGGIVVVFILPLFAGLLDILTGLVEALFEIANIGPLPGCGCIVLIAGCGLCAAVTVFISNIAATCGTPDAVNFCRFIP